MVKMFEFKIDKNLYLKVKELIKKRSDLGYIDVDDFIQVAIKYFLWKYSKKE